MNDTKGRMPTGYCCNTTLEEIVDIQGGFDTLYWTAPHDKMGKRRHIVFHIAELLGKIAKIEERADHKEVTLGLEANEIIADLLVYAAQLSDIYGVNPTEAYRSRLSKLSLYTENAVAYEANAKRQVEVFNRFVKGKNDEPETC